MTKKGIILAGGTGTRLAPLNELFNKHLVPINNKFIIDYPLKTLKQIGVEQLTIVLGGSHFQQIVAYLKDGKDFGFEINYVYQPRASGIAQAIDLCKSYMGDDDFTVCLGDNIFENKIEWDPRGGAQIVLYRHPELNRFGVASLDENKCIAYVDEKPKVLYTGFDHLAITGCYRFTKEYFDYYKNIKPSARGEFEITDIIDQYISHKKLHYIIAEKLWSDAGTFSSIHYVSEYFWKNDHK